MAACRIPEYGTSQRKYFHCNRGIASHGYRTDAIQTGKNGIPKV